MLRVSAARVTKVASTVNLHGLSRAAASAYAMVLRARRVSATRVSKNASTVSLHGLSRAAAIAYAVVLCARTVTVTEVAVIFGNPAWTANGST